jgi:hypothetical protein
VLRQPSNAARSSSMVKMESQASATREVKLRGKSALLLISLKSGS